MSGPGFGLVIGAQTKAAGYVVDFESKLVDVADMLESCILDDVARVNGPYVSVLSDALQRWGEGANGLFAFEGVGVFGGVRRVVAG